MIVDRVADLGNLPRLRDRILPTGFFMVSPSYFDVKYIINDFMRPNVGNVAVSRAIKQWDVLHTLLSKFAPVTVLPPSENMGPDTVFAANAGLTYFAEKILKQHCVLSTMKFPDRYDDVPYYKEALSPYAKVLTGLPNRPFEGQGDALFHGKKNLLWGGYGPRTDRFAYSDLVAWHDFPVIRLELVSEFYHLDTCFCPLDDERVLYYPAAFTDEGNRLIEAMFKKHIKVSREAALQFICNSIIVGDHIIVPDQRDRSEEFCGLEVHYVDMSEFIKSGGAARCLVLDDYRHE